MVESGNVFPESARLVPNRHLYFTNGGHFGAVLALWGVSFWRDVDPTLPPPTLFEVAVTVLYKHCSIAAIPIFKKQDPNTHITIPPP